MANKWNYVFGFVTIGLIIGGTAYAIKKSKDAEKLEEDVISLEEARKIVEQNRKKPDLETLVNSGKMTAGPFNVDGDVVHFNMQDVNVVEEDEEKAVVTPLDEKIAKKVEESIKVRSANDDVEKEEDGSDEYEVDGDPMYDKYERAEIEEDVTATPYHVEPLSDFSYLPEEGIDPKEDKELRHDPNSPEARHQYVRMEVADWEVGHPIHMILIKLFEFPFIPTTDGDEILRTQIIDHKVQFYGFNSRWNREVSFADVIFHYARAAEFNCGESVQYWVEYFLDFVEIDWESSSQQIDDMLMRLNSHSYFNEERQTFGLFGLTRESMDQAIRIANRNIDRSVTYEIEFNEFLKSCI